MLDCASLRCAIRRGGHIQHIALVCHWAGHASRQNRIRHPDSIWAACECAVTAVLHRRNLRALWVCPIICGWPMRPYRIAPACAAMQDGGRRAASDSMQGNGGATGHMAMDLANVCRST